MLKFVFSEKWLVYFKKSDDTPGYNLSKNTECLFMLYTKLNFGLLSFLM